jgi:hypothetical protein
MIIVNKRLICLENWKWLASSGKTDPQLFNFSRQLSIAHSYKPQNYWLLLGIHGVNSIECCPKTYDLKPDTGSTQYSSLYSYQYPY